MSTPALVIGYGGASIEPLMRIRWLAQEMEWPLYAEQHDEFSDESAEVVAKHVGQGGPLLLIHLIRFDDRLPDPSDPSDDRQMVSALEGANGHAERLARAYPGVDLRQWAVVLTGRTIDPSEAMLLASLADSMRGVLVTAASTSTSVAHPPEVESAFGADLVILLGLSDLEAQIAEVGGVWICGVSSVGYSADRLRLSVAASRAAEMAARLLEAEDAGGTELGEQWLEDRELDVETAWLGLLDSPAGGSLLSRVRFGDLDFRGIPVGSWTDAILSRHDMAVVGDISIITERVRAAADVRLCELRTATVAMTLSELETTKRIIETMAFCDGVALALGRAIDTVERAAKPNVDREIDEDRRKLRGLLKWLPYGPAVAVRLLIAALFVLLIGAVAAGSRTVPVNVLLSPWPAAAAGAVLVLGASIYGRRLRRTVRVRDRLAKNLEHQLVDRVHEIARAAHLDMLHRLSRWLGSQPPWWPDEPDAEIPETASSVVEWLAWTYVVLDRTNDELVQRSEHRTIRGVGTTEFAIDVPTTDAIRTDSLAPALDEDSMGGAVREFIAFVLPLLSREPPVVPTEDLLLDETTTALDTEFEAPWRNLEGILADNAVVAREARSVLQADLTPTGGDSPEVLHYLIVPGGREGGVAQRLLPRHDDVAPGVLVQLTDVRPTSVPSFAAMVHLYRLEVAAERAP